MFPFSAPRMSYNRFRRLIVIIFDRFSKSFFKAAQASLDGLLSLDFRIQRIRDGGSDLLEYYGLLL